MPWLLVHDISLAGNISSVCGVGFIGLVLAASADAGVSVARVASGLDQSVYSTAPPGDV